MIMFLLLLLIPLGVVLAAKVFLHQTITWLEMFSTFVVTSLLIAIVYWAGLYSEMYDKQILNGKVVSKEMDRVHCRHSYSCNCRQSCSGSGSSRSCSTICDTCYEHSFDQDWNVKTTLRGFTIDTIDRQGLKEPSRWTQVRVNDPVAVSDSYINYVKAVPESLFHFDVVLKKKYEGSIPAYPGTIFDYYKINRFVSQVPVPDTAQWNQDISTMLNDIGKSKQVNVIVHITKNDNSSYAKALQAAWIGGKKNDVILVIGAPNYPEISWVEVIAWSKNNIFNVQLRDEVKEIGKVDRYLIIPALHRNIVSSYVRKPMSDFEYLKDEIEPPVWVIGLAVILSLIASFGLSWFFHKEDLASMMFSQHNLPGYNSYNRRFH